MANPLSYPVLGVPVPVTVNEGSFALGRVLLPEPDDLPPTEAQGLRCFLVGHSPVDQQLHDLDAFDLFL